MTIITNDLTLGVEMRVNKLKFKFKNENYNFYYPLNGKKHKSGFENILLGKTYPLVPDLKPKFILDVGANLGATSMFFALNYPKAKIFSFEPTKMNFRWLKKNTEKFENIQRVNKGAYFKDTKTKIFLDSEVGGRNSIYKEWTKSDLFEIVDFINLKAFIETNSLFGKIDILKIDTEGCEIEILSSIEDDLKNIAVIYLEYHGKKSEKIVLEVLSKSHFLVQKKAVAKESKTVSFELLGSICLEDITVEGKSILQFGKRITEAHIKELQKLSIQYISVSSDSLGELLFVNKSFVPPK